MKGGVSGFQSIEGQVRIKREGERNSKYYSFSLNESEEGEIDLNLNPWIAHVSMKRSF